MKNIKTIDLGFIKIIKYCNDKGDVITSNILDQNNKPILKILSNGELQDYIDGDIDILELRQDIYLVTTATSNIFIYKKENNISYRIIYQHNPEHLINDKEEKSAYLLTDYLANNNRIILREDGLYALYEITTGKRLSALYHNITEIDGLIITEINIENDTLIGDLNLNGNLIGRRMTSQKYNIAMSLTGNPSSSPTNLIRIRYPIFSKFAKRKKKKKEKETNFLL